MRKKTNEFEAMKISELVAQLNKSRVDIAKLGMALTSNPPKDTNLISKKKKRLARLLTELNRIKQEEKLKKLTNSK